jgi:hypothetical protein
MEPAHLGVQPVGYPGHRLGAESFAQYGSYYFSHSACTHPSQEHLSNKHPPSATYTLLPWQEESKQEYPIFYPKTARFAAKLAGVLSQSYD